MGEPTRGFLVAWYEQQAEDERRAAANCRRYATWLESDAATDVPARAKCGDPDELRDEAHDHETRALWLATTARLLGAPAPEAAPAAELPICGACSTIVTHPGSCPGSFAAEPRPTELFERIEDIIADACIEYANDTYEGTGLPCERAATKVLNLLAESRPGATDTTEDA